MAGDSKIISGGRAVLYVVDRQNNTSTPIGVFTSIDVARSLDIQPAYTLGRYEPAELTYVGSGPVTANASGFRVFKGGPYQLVNLPQLQDILNHESIELVVADRGQTAENNTQLSETPQSGNTVLTVKKVRPQGYTFSTSARSLSTFNVSFLGIIDNDETANAQNDPSSVPLTSGIPVQE